MTPQGKKALSLKKDRRNCYGENDKSSRKSIRRAKQRVNQAFRRLARQTLRRDAAEAEEVDDALSAVARKPWRKTPDQPLGALLYADLRRKLEVAIRQASANDSGFLSRLEERLLDSQLNKTEVRIVMRRARAVALDPNSARLDIPLRVAPALENLIASVQCAPAAAPTGDPGRRVANPKSREGRHR